MPLDRTRPVIGLYNADDCREFGAVHADQSLRDLRAWANAWGFTNLVAIGFSWPRVDAIRTGSFGSTAFGLVAREPAELRGRSFAQVAADVNRTFPEFVAVTQSTHTPPMFAGGDRDTGDDGGTSVTGIFIAAGARSLRFGWQYESGYEDFAALPPHLATLKAIGVVPHGRLGHPALRSSPLPLAELKLDPDVAGFVKRPDESLEAYYAREPLSAYCTRMARQAMARANWREPHVVIPNARFWPVDGFPAIPDAANRLQLRWLRRMNVAAVDPSTGWAGYGTDAARFLCLQIAAPDGKPMRPWRRWTFEVPRESGPLPCVAERIERDGTVARVEGSGQYDAKEREFVLPAPPGDATPFDTQNALAYDVRIDGEHVMSVADGRSDEAGWNWRVPFDPHGGLKLVVRTLPRPGARVELVRSHHRSPSLHRIDAFSLYVGTGTPNGPVMGMPTTRYPATSNMRLRPGFHGFMWQSGTGTFAYEAFRRGATAMIGLPAGPRSFMPEPQVILRNAMITGASLGEAHILSPARTQLEIAKDGRNVSIGLTVFGDWMYAPYAVA